MAAETLEDEKPDKEAPPVSDEETKDVPGVEQPSQGDAKQEENDEIEEDRPKENKISDDVRESAGEDAQSGSIPVREQVPEGTEVKLEVKMETEIKEDTEEKEGGPMAEENAGETEQLKRGEENEGKTEPEDVEEKGEEEDIKKNKKPNAKGGRKRCSVSPEDSRHSKKRSQESQHKKEGASTETEKKKEYDANSKDPVTPTSDRPTRERKSVKRFSVPLPAGKSGKTSAGKTPSIEKGRGTQLKDIPNVAFKLSKRKPDDNLQALHTILFGKKAKAHLLKRDIGLFSGYVWAENEEKQRNKVKEKLDRCVKEKLLDFCDVLNIPINKGTAKKEELSLKIVEFLESPHVTTELLLADKEQKAQKRRRNLSSSKPVGEGSTGKLPKKQTQMPQSEKKQQVSSETEHDDDDKAEPSDAKADSTDVDNDALPNGESDGEKSKSDEEEATPKVQSSIKKSSSKQGAKEFAVSKTSDKATPSKATPSKAIKSSEKSSNKSTSKKVAADPGSASGSLSKSKDSVSKKKNIKKEQQKDVNEKATGKKQTNKLTATVSIKDQGKNKSIKKAKNEPSREEMHDLVVGILKEVDFNTATLSDILRQLGTHFNQDLMHRKAEVKDIIADVINNMSDEDEEDNGDGGDDAEDEDRE